MDIYPAIDEEPFAFVKDVPSGPCGIEVRAESRDKVNALNDVVEWHDFGVRLTVAPRIRDNVHFCCWVDFAKRPEPFDVRKANRGRRDSFG